MARLEPHMVIRLKDMDYEDQFMDAWTRRQPDILAPVSPDYEKTLKRWRRMGVAMETIEDAIDVTVNKADVSVSNRFRYLCGIIWNAVEASGVSRTANGGEPRLYTQEEVDVMLSDEFDIGMDNGVGYCESQHAGSGRE